MSDAPTDEREQIRAQKREELLEKYGDSSSAGTESGDTPDEPITIEGTDHFQQVIQRHDVVLVDCYADWCGPCQLMEPVVETLAAETEAAVAKVDVDAHQQLAAELGAKGVPTLVLYVDGNPAERLVGAQDRGTLERLIQQAQ